MTKKFENELLGREVKIFNLDWSRTMVGVLVWVEKDYFILRQERDVLVSVYRNSIGAFTKASDPTEIKSQSK